MTHVCCSESTPPARHPPPATHPPNHPLTAHVLPVDVSHGGGKDEHADEHQDGGGGDGWDLAKQGRQEGGQEEEDGGDNRGKACRQGRPGGWRGRLVAAGAAARTDAHQQQQLWSSIDVGSKGHWHSITSACKAWHPPVLPPSRMPAADST